MALKQFAATGSWSLIQIRTTDFVQQFSILIHLLNLAYFISCLLNLVYLILICGAFLDRNSHDTVMLKTLGHLGGQRTGYGNKAEVLAPIVNGHLFAFAPAQTAHIPHFF